MRHVGLCLSGGTQTLERFSAPDGIAGDPHETAIDAYVMFDVTVHGVTALFQQSDFVGKYLIFAAGLLVIVVYAKDGF